MGLSTNVDVARDCDIVAFGFEPGFQAGQADDGFEDRAGGVVLLRWRDSSPPALARCAATPPVTTWERTQLGSNAGRGSHRQDIPVAHVHDHRRAARAGPNLLQSAFRRLLNRAGQSSAPRSTRARPGSRRSRSGGSRRCSPAPIWRPPCRAAPCRSHTRSRPRRGNPAAGTRRRPLRLPLNCRRAASGRARGRRWCHRDRQRVDWTSRSTPIGLVDCSSKSAIWAGFRFVSTG